MSCLPRGLLLCVVMGLAGCWDATDVAEGPEADAGAVADAAPMGGATPDMALPPDAGRLDAGVEADAEPEPDAEPRDDMELPDAAPLPDAEIPDEGLPDAAEPEPTPAPLGAPFAPEVESVWPASMAQLFAVEGGSLLAIDGEGPLLLISTLDAAPVTAEAGRGVRLSGEADLVDEIFAVAAVEGGVLVSTDAGLMALDEEGLYRSPLDALLPEPPRALAATGDGALWLAHEGALRRWAAGAVDALWLDGEALSAVDVVEGPDGDVWVAARPQSRAGGAPGRVLRTWIDEDDRLQALVGPGALSPDALVVDGDGSVWALAEGDLWQRPVDGPWRWWRLPEAVTEAFASPLAGDLWLRTAAGLWHHRAGEFRAVESELILGAPRQITVEADGALVLSDVGGLWRLRPERRVLLVGLPDGGTLDRPVPVQVRPDRAEQVITVEYGITDAEARPVIGGLLAGPPWGLTLDPGQLPTGALELSVQVTYDDDQQLRASLELDVLDVGPPTWSGDVEPIFIARCGGPCHGEGGSARPMHSPALWQMHADAALDAIVAGRMPLPPNPPVPPAEIAVIEAWMEGGFQE